MKRFQNLFGLFLLVACLTQLGAIEIGTFFDIGNLTYEDERTESTTDFSGAEYYWGLSVPFSHRISDEFSIEAALLYDPILKYNVYTIFTYQFNFFTIGVGPYFGILNTRETVLKAGISTSIRLDFPGILFASFRVDSSLGGRLVEVGDLLQERNQIRFGYYVPNAICSVNILTKNFAQKTAEGEMVEKFSEYSFKTDLFEKNVPYKILLTFGYQALTRTFVYGATPTEHSLHSIIIGTELDVELLDFLSLIADLDSSIYSFGFVDDTLMDLPEERPGIYLWRLRVGFSLNVDSLLKRR
jgi:hypothetical protein